MNTYKWLLKREFWEHKGGFFWAPAVVGAIMTLVLAVSISTISAVPTPVMTSTSSLQFMSVMAASPGCRAPPRSRHGLWCGRGAEALAGWCR